MNTFYPRLKEFLNESNEDIPKSLKIENQPYVMGHVDPKLKIDMKFLKSEIESAKTAIVSSSPLFAAYVHKFYPIYTWLVDTMGTDGVRLFINPEFANNLTWEQKIFVLIHEIMHCVLLHMSRIKGRDPTNFNIAGDYEINTIIVDTLNDFDEAFVKKMHGLYDIKYLNMPVETIYEQVIKNPPKIQGKPGQGQQGQGEGGKGQGGGQVTLKVGSKVRIKVTGKKGIVTKVNKDGTFEVDPINESFIPQLIKESYTRDQLIPILPPGKVQQGGQGGGQGEEIEIEGQGTTGGETTDPHFTDPGGTGAILDNQTGIRIAKASGYEENEMGPLEESSDTWRVEGAKMLERAEKSNPGSRGRGKGSALVSALYRIHRGGFDWKSLFKRFVATALSPEVEVRIGNKKHLGGDILRYGEKSKYEALSSIVVCVDVSGSMGKKSIEKILNEINNIIFSKRVNKITIIFFDDGVDDKSVQVIKRMGRPYIPTNISGGGGTSFQKPLDWIEEHLHNRVSLCVFFTDGGAPNPKKPPYARKFIWVVYDNPGWEPSFGRMVNMGNVTEDK